MVFAFLCCPPVLHSFRYFRPKYSTTINVQNKYEGRRSINKLQNGAIPSVLKIGKIQNICFVGNLILNIHTASLDDDRTQSICVLFTPSVYYRNSQVINSI